MGVGGKRACLRAATRGESAHGVLNGLFSHYKDIHTLRSRALFRPHGVCTRCAFQLHPFRELGVGGAFSFYAHAEKAVLMYRFLFFESVESYYTY